MNTTRQQQPEGYRTHAGFSGQRGPHMPAPSHEEKSPVAARDGDSERDFGSGIL